MAVEWLGEDFALDILAVFPLYCHFDCLFCHIIHRQVKKAKLTIRTSTWPLMIIYSILMTFTIYLFILLYAATINNPEGKPVKSIDCLPVTFSKEVTNVPETLATIIL